MKELADVIMDIRRARDNSILSLKIKGYALDIERLRPYIEYSDYLRFMLNPAEFDYSKVCIDKWEPLIFSEEYKHYFIENKDKLLTDELKKKFERGLSTRVEQKVVYGVLLNDKEEIRNF